MKPESAGREQNPPSSRACPASPLSLPFQRSPLAAELEPKLPAVLPFPCSTLQRTGNSFSLSKAQEQAYTGSTAQSLSALGSWSPGQGPTSHQVPPALGRHLGRAGAPAASEGCHLGSPEPPAFLRQSWSTGVASQSSATSGSTGGSCPWEGLALPLLQPCPGGWHCRAAWASTAQHSQEVPTGLGENWGCTREGNLLKCQLCLSQYKPTGDGVGKGKGEQGEEDSKVPGGDAKLSSCGWLC